MNRPQAAVRSRLALAALLAVASAVPAATGLRGSAAPDFVLKSLTGQNLRLSEYRGQIVMLAFWATWCGDCRAQLEQLGEMYDRYQEAGVELLAVSLDQNRKQAEAMTGRLGAKYPVLNDSAGDVGKLYAVDRMPVMVLIDRGGVVREVFEGFRRGSEQQYLDRVQALLRE
ncbi:MAG TPA: TlpA disulfide reductase family protein [Gammaproteobacteria bacterium]|jgi:peroxiredoxin|nr:TlpA disulfide reductase family protein [Gammaproteobacteria bacterium]